MKNMRFAVIFTTLVLISAICFTLLPVSGEEGLYGQFVRLHVLANSDSEEDQALKLKVRDRILEEVSGLVEGCEEAQEAAVVIEGALDRLTYAAASVIAENGYDYPVQILIGDEYYPTREYEELCLPAGVYNSVRVLIGEADGQNWWCVLFPPLCVNSAKAKPAKDELVAAGFTPSQIKLLTESDNPKYVMKFRFLEIIEELLSSIRNAL